jgi:1A family penicillin-binding protein
MQVRERPTSTVQKRVGKRIARPSWIAAAIILASLSAAAFTFSSTGSIWKPVPALRFAFLPDYGAGLQVFDRFDRKVATLYADKDQQPVKLQDVAPVMRQALLTAEDREFYRHGGVNLWAFARAILANIEAGKPVQGGSTLTQQLAKNIYFEGETRTIDRKLAEVVVAMELERSYKKDELLESYLNTVYFGHGVYGVERAAQKYFGKSASHLQSAEAAFLVALIPAPSVYSQTSNRQTTLEKQRRILTDMVETGCLTTAQSEKAKREKLAFHSIEGGAEKFPHYLSYVTRALEDKYGHDFWARGWHVYTNLDPSAQHLAERTLHNGVRKAPVGVSQGALVSISVADGGVIAMVGGAKEFSKNQWNRAINAHTAGSAFKPFVYLTGLTQGVLKYDTVLDDAPVSFRPAGFGQTYSPRNFDGQFLGPITIRKAIALSRNTCAVSVAQDVGPDRVIETAQLAGVTTKVEPNLSIALGSCAISPLDMANAYATLARGGEYIEPTFVRKLTDAEGRMVFESPPQSHRVFASEPVAQLVDALEDVVERGTGTRARLFDRPVAGKTGTADGGKDIWFAGFTPDLATVVWGGSDENQPIKGVTGGSVMASIWQNYMRSYYQAHTIPAGSFVRPAQPLIEEAEPLHFLPTPAGIFDRVIEFFTGDGTPTVPEYFYKEEEPRPASDFRQEQAQSSKSALLHDQEEPEPPRKKKRNIFKRLWNELVE